MEVTVERIKYSLENALVKVRKQKDIKYNLKALGYTLIGFLVIEPIAKEIGSL